MLRRVLRLDVVAGFTSESLDRLARLADPVAAAWRAAEPSDLRDWSGEIARAAGVTRPTVYARQRRWREEYIIDIALPYAFYRDLLHFGPLSLTRPRERDALIAAVRGGDGEEAVRPLAEAARRFDVQRVEVVGSAIDAPLHPMPSRVARRVLPRWERADLRRGDQVEALDGRSTERRARPEESPATNVRGRQPWVADPSRG